MKLDDRLSELLAICRIQEMVQRCADASIHCKWYLFGSAIHGKFGLSDIDVLTIVKEGEDARRLRRLVADLLELNPVHLTILNADEEKELDFIAYVGAVPLSLQ